MTANVPVKFLFEVSNNMVSGDDSAKNGTQLSFIEESCIIKELVLKLIFRYDQFISSKSMLLSAGLKCLNSSRTYATQIQEEKAFNENICQEKRAKLFRLSNKEICTISWQTLW